MQEQSWVRGHLEWLIGAVVLLPIGYIGKRLLNRWSANRGPETGAMNLSSSFASISTARESSLPTADDLQDAYNLVAICYRADLLRNYVGLDVCWPGFLVGAYARPEAPEYAYLHFRFDGEKANGTLFRCQVRVADYPILEAAKEKEAKAWVRGEIAGIVESCITLTNPTVEFQ